MYKSVLRDVLALKRAVVVLTFQTVYSVRPPEDQQSILFRANISPKRDLYMVVTASLLVIVSIPDKNQGKHKQLQTTGWLCFLIISGLKWTLLYLPLNFLFTLHTYLAVGFFWSLRMGCIPMVHCTTCMFTEYNITLNQGTKSYLRQKYFCTCNDNCD